MPSTPATVRVPTRLPSGCTVKSAGPAPSSVDTVDRRPGDRSSVSASSVPTPCLHTVDDPLEAVFVGTFARFDGQMACILCAGGVHSVQHVLTDDRVGTGVIAAGEQRTPTSATAWRRACEDHAASGVLRSFMWLEKCIERCRVIPRWVYAVAIPLCSCCLGVMAFTIFEPIQVLPRIRLAPGFAMTDQAGDRLTSEDLRGEIVLYSFAYTRLRRAVRRTERHDARHSAARWTRSTSATSTCGS